MVLFSTSSAENFDSLKVPELKNMLRERGLKVSGRKSELVDRLRGDIDSSNVKGAAHTKEDNIDLDISSFAAGVPFDGIVIEAGKS